MTSVGTGFGAGKVILLGEHAVVRAGPGLAAGLGRGVKSIARPATTDLLRIEPWGRALTPNEDSEDPMCRALSAVLDQYPDRPRLRIDASVSLPFGAGLGCSAALGVSVIDAVDKALGIVRTRASLGERALEWERVFHGSPSGIDNVTSAQGGLIRFRKPDVVRALSPARPLHVVVAHSGQRSSTAAMVARTSRRLAREPDGGHSWLAEMKSLVDVAEVAIRRGDLEALGGALSRNHEMLRALGLSTPRIEKLCETARGAGALGAKVTGAGGGGCVIALADTAARAAFVGRQLGPRTFVEELGRAA